MERMELQVAGVHFLDCKQRAAEYLSASGCRSNILVAIRELIYNPVVICTLVFQYFVQIFLLPNNYTPALKLSISPSFLVFIPFKYLQIVSVSPS